VYQAEEVIQREASVSW